MLSGEGNAGERLKTTIGLIRKTQLSTCNTLFWYLSLPLFCTVKLLETSEFYVYGGNVVRVLVHLFFTAAHFHLALVAATISHFVTSATKCSCCSSDKKMSPLFFSSRSRSLTPFLSLSFAGLPAYFLFFSVFLLLYIPNLWT